MNVSTLVYEVIKSLLPLLPILIPLSAIVFLFVPSRRLLSLFLFFMGFQALFIDVGVMVNIPRILIFFTLMTLLIYFPKDFFRAIREYPGRVMLIIIFMFFIASALMNIPNFPVKNIVTAYGPIGDSLFRDRATRQTSQIMMFLLKASIPVAILAICRSRKDVIKMIKIVIAGTLFLCLYGVYQNFAFLYDLPAIYIFRGALNPAGGIGQFSTSFGDFFRISSLAGEPKDLAGVLLPISIFIGMITWYLLKKKMVEDFRKMPLLGVFLLHVIIFILTFSTAGWLGGIVAVISALIFSINWQPKFRTIVFGLFVFLGIASVYILVPSVNDLINKRFFERLNPEYLTSNRDYGVPQLLHMYKTRPETIFYGASLGGAIFYEQYNEQPESIVFYLFDYGIIGIMLFGIFFFTIVKTNTNLSKQFNLKDDPVFNALSYATVGSMVATLVFPKIDSLLGLWVLIGLTSALVLRSKDDSSNAVTRIS